MKRMILALALVACAAPLCAQAGGRFAEHRAERKTGRCSCSPCSCLTASAKPVATAIHSVRQVAAVPVKTTARAFKFLAAPVKSACANGRCAD